MKEHISDIFDNIDPAYSAPLITSANITVLPKETLNRLICKTKELNEGKNKKRRVPKRILLYATAAAIILITVVSLPMLLNGKTPNDNILYPATTNEAKKSTSEREDTSTTPLDTVLQTDTTITQTHTEMSQTDVSTSHYITKAVNTTETTPATPSSNFVQTTEKTKLMPTQTEPVIVTASAATEPFITQITGTNTLPYTTDTSPYTTQRDIIPSTTQNTTDIGVPPIRLYVNTFDELREFISAAESDESTYYNWCLGPGQKYLNPDYDTAKNGAGIFKNTKFPILKDSANVLYGNYD